MDEGAQALFYDSIQHLYLSVALWMIHRAHSQLCATPVKQFLLELTQEQWVSIRDQAARQPVDFPYYVHEQGDDHYEYD